ncbi:MAG TPA: ABC transporter ATP-binding protein [Pseudonocardiaceae bacterium]|jgi:ATP-binding cassette subfamily B protein
MPERVASDATALLRRVAVRTPGWLVAATLSGVLAAVAGLLLPDAMARAVDGALAGNLSGAGVPLLLGIVVTIAGADAANEIATAVLTSTGTAWLRRMVADHVIGCGDQRGVRALGDPGDLVSRLTGDAAQAGGVAATAIQLVLGAITSIGAILALALLDPWLAAVFAASVPLALLLARTHLRTTSGHIANYRELAGELSARLLDAALGIRTIAATGTAEQETARVLRPLPALGRAGHGMWRTQAVMIWRAALLLPAVQLAVLVAAGLGVLDGRLTPGQLLAALGYTGMGMTLIGYLPTLTTLATARAGAGRLAEVLEVPVRPAGELALPAGAGELDLRDVTVLAGDGSVALSDVDLLVPAGAVVAVVGRSGAGKSTLAAVAGGLVPPDRGDVLLDGVSMRQIRPDELRAAVGFAFERPALLGGTVGGVIGYGSDADADAVTAAARSARVHDAVCRLPDGYHTPLAEAPLSGGEAQRLGLARAFVRAPRVLVLDDATGSLDAVTEAEVDHSVRTGLPGHTRLVVTHRLRTAEHADLVVWLDGGKVRGTGRHVRLWRDPDYRAVFTQAGE